MKNRRYRRGNVADEVPSTIALDNDDEEEQEEEIQEPGEIVDEEHKTSIEPYNYPSINEDEILSTSKSKGFFHTLIFIIEFF